jgi:hypothetical protein
MTNTLTLDQARALWWHKQGLAGTTKGTVASVVGSTGWLRTLGGTDAYLAARARKPKMKRADLDAALASGALRVVPAARGCIYVVPDRVVADLMALNVTPWRTTTEKDLGKAKSSMAVVEKVAKAVLSALTKPMTTDALRKALPAGSIPSFGDAGKKAGISSPLPLALRLLEFTGKVERTLERLDSEKYQWRKATWKVPAASANPLASVIDAFLEFSGPATLAQIVEWSGRAQRDLKPVLEEIGAVAIEVAGMGPAWGKPGDLKARPAPSGISLVGFEDNYVNNHGLGLVADPKLHAVEVDIWGSGKPEAVGKARHVLSRTIIRDGLVIGFWEVDPGAKGGVWSTFDKPPKALAKQLDEAVADTAAFMLDDVGNAITYSLDTMEMVQERAKRVAKLARK